MILFSSYYFMFFIPLFISITLIYQQQKNVTDYMYVREKRKKGVEPEVKEFLEKAINKFILVKTINNDYYGKVVKSEDNWLTIADKKGVETIINIEFIVSAKEYGNKKTNA